MEGIGEPVPRDLQQCLRLAALDHVSAGRRRSFPAMVHVGLPRGVQRVYSPAGDVILDQALRTDILAALLRHTATCNPSPPIVWLTRPGRLDLEDVDAAWLAASRAAFAEAECRLTFVVVTRSGWRDPRSATQRTWRRLRAS